MADVIVLGAGMVGISTALALQARGYDCVVLDRRAPGREASFGNAGIIQAEALEPYALPWRPWEMLRLALGEANAVSVTLRGIAGQGGALARYWWQSLPKAHARASAIYAKLIRHAVSAHSPLIEAAGAEALITREGYLEAYRDRKSLDAAMRDAERLRRDYGAEVSALDAQGLKEAEPAFHNRFEGALHWEEPWACRSPGGLVEAYVRLFTSRGGEIATGDAMTLSRNGAGWRVAGLEAPQVVVALGASSPELLSRFGYRVPMVRKRGYHLHFRGDHGLSRPVVDAQASIVMSPMEQGLRMATGADLSRGPPQARPPQLARGIKAVRACLDVGPVDEEEFWNGLRPCLPGMLPLVREAPRHRGLWMNFGHGHQGFTLGPITGHKLAQAMVGDQSAVAGLGSGIR